MPRNCGARSATGGAMGIPSAVDSYSSLRVLRRSILTAIMGCPEWVDNRITAVRLDRRSTRQRRVRLDGGTYNQSYNQSYNRIYSKNTSREIPPSIPTYGPPTEVGAPAGACFQSNGGPPHQSNVVPSLGGGTPLEQLPPKSYVYCEYVE